MLTLAAPPKQVGGTASARPVLVTAPGTLALTGGPAEVSLEGGGFLGIGRQDEVQAWLQDVAHVRVDGVSDQRTLATTDVGGVAPGAVDPAADPQAADIWQQESAGDAPGVSLPEPRADQVLVAVADTAAPVDLSWERTARHPGAWPSVVLGVLLVLLGSAWLSALNARRRRSRRRVPARA